MPSARAVQRGLHAAECRIGNAGHLLEGGAEYVLQQYGGALLRGKCDHQRGEGVVDRGVVERIRVAVCISGNVVLILEGDVLAAAPLTADEVDAAVVRDAKEPWLKARRIL